jgi:hypothetical protein
MEFLVKVHQMNYTPSEQKLMSDVRTSNPGKPTRKLQGSNQNIHSCSALFGPVASFVLGSSSVKAGDFRLIYFVPI